MHNTKFHRNTRRTFDDEWADEGSLLPLHGYVPTSEQ